MSKIENLPVHVGQQVQGVVYKVLPHFVLVRLPAGLHGILRQREVSWDEERPDLEKVFKVGDSIKAVVTKISEEENSIELSLRLAQRDPWDDFVKTHAVGGIVTGIVRGVREFGAFVEIEKGIEGLLPVSEIRYGEHVEKAQDVLWVGDQVVAVLQEIDLQQRKLRLSIKAYQDIRSSEFKRPMEEQISLKDFLDPVTQRRLRQAMGDIPKETVWFEPKHIQRVLIADDHEGFRTSLAQTLRDWGCIVLEAHNFQAVRDAIESSFDLIILDYHLSDGSTLSLAWQVVEKQKKASVLLLTGFEIDENEIAEARASGFAIEYKPFGPADLLEFLQRLEEQYEQTPHRYKLPETQQLESEKEQKALRENKNPDVQFALEQLVVQSGAQRAVLFRESIQKKGEIEWPYTVNFEITDPEAPITLQYSPVGDALYEQRRIVIQDVQKNPAGAKYLSRAVPFRACFGVPLHVSNSSSRYAVFFFFDQPLSSKLSEEWWQKKSEFLAQQIDREQVANLFINAQGELLRGQLRAGALHDVRNSLGGLEHVLDGLMRKVEELDTSYPPSEHTIENIRTNLLEAQAFTRQMKKTAELFRELGLSTKLELVSVNDIVRRSVERQMPLAGHLAVHLDFKPDNDLPATLLRPAHLQQAVENVILNGIQWCAERRIRQVSVRTAYRPQQNGLPIEISVEDTGPGIHRQLQDHRIFEMGYSTRPNGSGLGLFVARILLESMGGKIRVAHSVMEVGTTFVIELPLRKNP